MKKILILFLITAITFCNCSGSAAGIWREATETAQQEGYDHYKDHLNLCSCKEFCNEYINADLVNSCISGCDLAANKIGNAG